MNETTTNALGSEWNALQNHYYGYEKLAIVIKLTAVALAAFALAVAQMLWPALAITLLLWLQEGILRTWQSRVVERLMRVESALRADEGGTLAFQLHSQWQENRPNGGELVRHYVRHSWRPTVAIPYALLMALIVVALLLRFG